MVVDDPLMSLEFVVTGLNILSNAELMACLAHESRPVWLPVLMCLTYLFLTVIKSCTVFGKCSAFARCVVESSIGS